MKNRPLVRMRVAVLLTVPLGLSMMGLVACSGGGTDTAAVCSSLGPALKAVPATSAATKAPADGDKDAFTTAIDHSDGELNADLTFLNDLSKKLDEDPNSVDKSMAPKVNEAFKRVLDWTATNCPGDGPYWNCITQSRLASVPAADDDESLAGTDMPEAALAPTPEGTTRTEVARTETLVTYQVVNQAGRVTQIQDVENLGSGWRVGNARGC